MKKFSFLFSSRLWLVLLIGAAWWGFKSGRLLYTGYGFSLASYKVPANAPVAQVHPEVLNLQASFSKVAELVKPAVVNIATVQIEQIPEAPMFFYGDPFEFFFDEQGQSPHSRQPRQGRPRTRQFRQEGVGSGVIIDPDGLILTNEHVVRRADEIKVYLYDKDGTKKEYPGKVIGKDARTDLAVVRIKGPDKFPFAKLGDSTNVKVGDWSIAIGSPFGLAQTVTVGVISADRQSLAIEDREYRNMIQTDAAINRGNSGGPLLNIYGEVIGINTAIYAPTGVFSGVGFAVPINQAKLILEDLLKRGRVVRGWLGVEMGRDIPPAMVKAFNLPDAKGALVNSVIKDSPAAKAGLKRGDVVRRFDGKPVDSADVLQSLVSSTPPKKTVPLEIIRDGKQVTLSLTLGERPDSADTGAQTGAEPGERPESGSRSKEWLGAKVVPAPDEMDGVVVVDVESGSVAETMGLLRNDLIRGVNQTPTPTVASFERAVSRVKLSEGVVLDILRQGRSLYLSYTKP